MSNIMDTFSDSASKNKSVSFFEEERSNSVTYRFNRLFGREKPVHHLLGGGKCRVFLVTMPIFCHNQVALSHHKWHCLLKRAAADVLLWRNKKISAGVLTSATAVWVLFEWLNYNFLTLMSFALILGMLAQFVWQNASGFLNRWWFSKCGVCFLLFVFYDAICSMTEVTFVSWQIPI